MPHPLFGLEVVSKKKMCGFCRGQMEKGDFQFGERSGSSYITWCLACGLLRLAEIQKLLDDVRSRIGKEMEHNPDRYVRTTLTAEGKQV